MAERTLKDLVRRVLSSSMALGGASQNLAAMPPSPSTDNELLNATRVALPDATRNEVVIRAARPRVLLQALDVTRFNVFSSHRSHRSHSSHRSHYSSSAPVYRPPDTARTTKQSGATALASPTLGSRVLERGMRGKDVEELLLLLLRNKVLPVEKLPSENLFTAEVEKAVKSFQRAKGIKADGKVDYRTLLLLKAQ